MSSTIVLLADPQGASALAAAASWVQATLLGTFATIIAVVAVASVGLLMLWGEVDLRRGLTVIAGCFVLFGAPTLAAGLRSLGNSGHGVEPAQTIEPIYPTLPKAGPQRAPDAYDPYAGASVPQ